MRSYTIQTENWDKTLIGCFYQLFLFMETEMNLFLFTGNYQMEQIKYSFSHQKRILLNNRWSLAWAKLVR